MDRSESLQQLILALAKAQAQMKNPPVDSVNPHFRSKYASLAAVRDAVVAALAAQGLAVVQPLSTPEGRLTCETWLLHESGEYLATSMTLPVDPPTPQGYGLVATYLRRYALTALLCVAGDDEEPDQARSLRVHNAVDTYTADGLRERITALLEDRQVPAERQRQWWQEQCERYGDPVPLPALRHLYRRLREASQQRPQQPQEAPSPAPTGAPPAVDAGRTGGPAGRPAGPPHEGAAWDTLRAHRSDPRLSEALRHRVQLVVAGTVTVSEQEANTLAGHVLDCLDATEEDPT